MSPARPQVHIESGGRSRPRDGDILPERALLYLQGERLCGAERRDSMVLDHDRQPMGGGRLTGGRGPSELTAAVVQGHTFGRGAFKTEREPVGGQIRIRGREEEFEERLCRGLLIGNGRPDGRAVAFGYREGPCLGVAHRRYSVIGHPKEEFVLAWPLRLGGRPRHRAGVGRQRHPGGQGGGRGEGQSLAGIGVAGDQRQFQWDALHHGAVARDRQGGGVVELQDFHLHRGRAAPGRFPVVCRADG